MPDAALLPLVAAGALAAVLILPAYLIGPAEDLFRWWRRRP